MGVKQTIQATKQAESTKSMHDDKIDIVSVDPVTGSAKLIIAVSAASMEMPELELKKIITRKVNACANFVRSGQLYKEYPANVNLRVKIEVVFETDITDGIGIFLDEIAAIADRNNFEFGSSRFDGEL